MHKVIKSKSLAIFQMCIHYIMLDTIQHIERGNNISKYDQNLNRTIHYARVYNEVTFSINSTLHVIKDTQQL